MPRPPTELSLSRRAGLGVLALGLLVLPASYLVSVFLIGLPFAAWAAGRIVAVFVDLARGRAARPAASLPAGHVGGVIALVFVALHALGALFGGLVTDLLPQQEAALGWVASALAGLAGSMVLGVVLGPFALAPQVATTLEGRQVLLALRTSVELSSRRAAGRSARAGARVGLLYGVAWVATFEGVVRLFDEQAFLPLVLASVLQGLVFLSVQARSAIAYAGLTKTDAESSNAVLKSRLLASTAVVAPVAALTLLTLLAVALTPLPLESAPAQQIQRGLVRGSATSLPSSDVQLRTDADALYVEAADGGGAGRIECGFDCAGAFILVRTVDDEPRAYEVILRADGLAGRTLLDSRGVRLDDGLGRRVRVRLGWIGAAALVVGLAGLALFVFLFGADLGRARSLSAPPVLGGPEGGGLRALTGVLRLSGSKQADIEASRLRPPDGDAWLEVESLGTRLRLPPEGVPVIGAPVSSVREGVELTVIGHFARLSGGLREGQLPWPESARLAVGTLDDARRILVRRAERRLGILALPITGGFGVALAIMLGSWL